MDRIVRKIVALGLVLAMTGVGGLALADTKEKDVAKANELLMKSRQSFNDLVKEEHPDKSIPRDLLAKAKAIAVFPKVLNAAIGFGGRHGKGVVTVRGADGKWSPPALFDITGGSWGFQIGAQSTELVLFFMTDGSVKSLVESKFTLGGKAGLAAGPMGRSAEAATDIKLNAEIYSYAKSKGLFAGISLEGARMSADKSNNIHFYDADVSTQDILFNGKAAKVPESAQNFMAALPD